MDRGLFVAASSTSALMERQGLISQNMANVSTPGFKRLFDRQVAWPAPEQAQFASRVYAPLLTAGVDTTPGVLVKTDNPLDLAFPEDHYLGINLPGGGEAFTRRGDLTLDDQGVLRLSTGEEVQGEGGAPIAIPAGFIPNVASDGTVAAVDPANPKNRAEVGRLRWVSSAKDGVTMLDNGRLGIKAPQDPTERAKIVSGAVEQSNVSAAEMLVKMIETSRLHDLNGRLISAFSSTDQKGTELLSGWQ